ncbi:MAG: hypothetical protein O7D91_08040 [Planctomycetota bacterium]|nr:hypothetical protein [Planctomycetota bacterium]
MNETTIELDWKPGHNCSGTLSAKLADAVLHVDKLDILRASARKRFGDELLKHAPTLERTELDAALLRLAEQVQSRAKAEPSTKDVDVSSIARPELFHVSELSGLTVPAVRLLDGKPVGVLEQFLRWHEDGRRERRELESSIELPDGRQLWLHPQPSPPEPTMRPGWSIESRQAYLGGAPAPDPVKLWQAIVERLTYFIEFPPGEAAGVAATLSLWAILTYGYPAWSSLPYLNAGGPLGSGKTVLLRVLSRMVFRPLESSNLTCALVFRTLHENGGTLLLDEAERLRDGAPDAAELRSILLSGYKPGSPAMRLEKVGDTFKAVSYQVYGPKALAAIANLPEALASRCIRICMFRAAPDSPKPRRRLDAEPHLWQAIRDDLHVTALEYGHAWLELSDRPDVVPAELAGRDFELWQPLLALAAWLQDSGADGLLKLVQDHAIVACDSARDLATPESDELLLKLLAERVVGGTHAMLKAGDLLKLARDLEPVTFERWSPRGIGAAIRRYGLITRKGHGSTGRTYRLVTLEALRRIERAYGFDLGLPSVQVPQVPQVPLTDDGTATHAVHAVHGKGAQDRD